MTHGLKAAGIDVLAGIDNDGSCKATFEKNNEGAMFLEKDITEYSPAELERDLEIEKEDKYMVFAGCAPCQFWSIIQTNKEKSEKTKKSCPGFSEIHRIFQARLRSSRECTWNFFEARKSHGKVHSRSQTYEVQ